ncbi:class I SAM-dependent methyltransferase [Magnetococcus sp. PR-3]|uniref:class I SAM-dependent methyltransferase n=1 Tax=Magnetococcus sp. PR-3 TaxID=3120355 RepID=UPI002FCE037A
MLPSLLRSRAVKKIVGPIYYRVKWPGQAAFSCPICGYHGPFGPLHLEHYSRPNEICPVCLSMQRARFQSLVINKLLDQSSSSGVVVHYAPEKQIEKLLREKAANYIKTDYCEGNVQFFSDMCKIPLRDKSVDLLFASHVLEHIQDDQLALNEVKRVLKDDGAAILPVPIVSETTVEYGAPNPLEYGHVRAPGLDYYDKLKAVFSRVELISSSDYPAKYQLSSTKIEVFTRPKWRPNGHPCRGISMKIIFQSASLKISEYPYLVRCT